MANYSYPRVVLNTHALTHSVSTSATDTTVLFSVFASSKGPTGEVVHVHSLSEFKEIFGDLDIARNGETALNIYNWLTYGGTLYGVRLSDTADATAKSDNYSVATVTNETFASLKASLYTYSDSTYTLLGQSAEFASGTTYYVHNYNISAKYPGSYYNDISLRITCTSAGHYAIAVRYKSASSLFEKYGLTSAAEIKNFLVQYSANTYVTVDSITDAFLTGIAVGSSKTITLSGGVDSAAYISTLANTFWTGNQPAALLGSKLAEPVDLILDAGYLKTTKAAMATFVNNTVLDANSDVAASRPDIVLILDRYVSKDSIIERPAALDETGFSDAAYTATNIAIYDHYFTVNDAIFTDNIVYVMPSYFLSKLLPYNDLNSGVQAPTAGLRRGILEDALSINENLKPADKESKFKARINYVEKTSREYSFMSQRTHDGSTADSYTALSFLNNERALERMKKDIETLGRDYLFEFNDSTTLSQMSKVLNKYITEWISNRTLAGGSVTVSKNANNEEAVDISMNIQFTGTIEVISVDITIE